MTKQIDDTDKKIIGVLRQNAKLKTQNISKKINVPITTVHNRIKRMEKDGTIKGYTAVLNNKMLDKSLKVMVMVKVDHQQLTAKGESHEAMLKKIMANPAIERVNLMAGDIDFIIEARVKDIDALNAFSVDFLRNVKGVLSSSTLVVLEEKTRYEP